MRQARNSKGFEAMKHLIMKCQLPAQEQFQKDQFCFLELTRGSFTGKQNV